MRTLLIAALVTGGLGCAARMPYLGHKHVRFPQDATEMTIVSGPPETAGLMSGYVVLKSGADMPEHTTGANEELLVVISGHGEVVLGGGDHVEIGASEAMYIPPHTAHAVHASGSDDLRYVYVVAPTR
jgi:mannose-6-phosphate isomerase-like protein (cupin superfamily)